MHRWHPIDHEHDYRQAVIDRLDRIVALLSGAASAGVSAGVSTAAASEPPGPPSGWSCPLCQRTFGSEHALRVHTTRAHRGRR